MTDNVNSANNLYNQDVRTTENEYAATNPVDKPMPDPAAANAKARAIFEENHKNDADTTVSAGEQAFNPAAAKLATDMRQAGRATSRANEATDPNDTGSGGIPAGGVKSGSSIQ